MPGRAPSAPRCAAIVGPYSSGKTSLLESLLHVTGALSKKGSAKEKTLLGDSSAEARARGLSVILVSSPTNRNDGRKMATVATNAPTGPATR